MGQQSIRAARCRRHPFFKLPGHGRHDPWAWGDNYYGQLGTGSNLPQASPVQAGLDNDWVDVSTYDRHIIALKMDGSVYTWGDNYIGQLGTGNTLNANRPVRVQF